MFFNFGKKKKVCGIGMDGFPHSLAVRLMEEGHMPNLQRLAAEGDFRRIRSVYPTVSNVAWASFQTGRGPGEFGVFGYVELRPDLSLYVPNFTHLKADTIWRRMNDAGKRIVALGMPMTWPAPKVNGLLVSGFLAPELDERAVSSSDVLKKLRWTMYEIDADPRIAQKSLDAYQEEVRRVATARQRTALELVESEDWDLFFCHVMDTDRVNHFLWHARRDPDSPRGEFFYDFYAQVDDFLGRMDDALPSNAELLILSDHGFCDLENRVQLNRWLRREGYLEYEEGAGEMFQGIQRGSRAFSLVPGRIHLLTKWRWEIGTVSDIDYQRLREEIAEKLRDMTHPETGEPVCRRVLTREEAFTGRYAEDGPDLIIDPHDGFELQAALGEGDVFEPGTRSGAHTCSDAMLLTGQGLAKISKAEDVPGVGRRLAEHFSL